MKYIFGPVPSRRLGLSLGIDILPKKTCNMDCIYCEIGKGKGQVNKRDFYTNEEEILKELKDFLRNEKRTIDCITITASGEPTLHKGLKSIIEGAKNISEKPVVVLTNASLCWIDEIRKALCLCDLVLPSLDAASEKTFRKINRPHPEIKPDRIIDGLIELQKEMKGEMWLECLFVRGINDSIDEIEALKRAISKIAPDKIQLNTVVRPPSENFAHPVSKRRLFEIKEILGYKAEVIVDFEKKMEEGSEMILESEIVDTIKRRPLTMSDIRAIFGRFKKSQRVIESLLSKGIIRKTNVNGKAFFVAT